MLERLHSIESPFRDVYRHARKHPRATLGAAAGTAAAVIGITAGVSAAATPAHPTAGSPFPAAHATPIVTGSHRAAPAITGPPAAATTHDSVAHSSAAVQPQQHAAAKAASPAAAQVTTSPPAAPAQQAAPGQAHGQQAHSRRAQRSPGGPAAVIQHITTHHGHRAWRAALARHPRPRAHQTARKAWPYLIYDSVTPSAIPSHHVIATYATGSYAASASDVAGRKAVLWIDTQGSDPQATALDVEPGDATPSMAASWAWQRLHAHPSAHAIIYTMRSEWAAAQASIATLPQWMQHHVRWWIADPTGYAHVVPGSNATQWYWGQNYDITTATPGF